LYALDFISPLYPSTPLIPISALPPPAQIFIITRHGTRDTIEKGGELSEIGKNEMIEYGRRLRKWYGDEFKKEEIYARSTRMTRCIGVTKLELLELLACG
jgi:hypothetical protein